jgi:hypothetical protein
MSHSPDSLDFSFSSRLGFHVAILQAISLVVLLFALFTVGR